MYISWSVHHKESCFKVAVCIYQGVFIPIKSCFKLAESIYHWEFIPKEVVLKLRNVFIMHCSSQGKLF